VGMGWAWREQVVSVQLSSANAVPPQFRANAIDMQVNANCYVNTSLCDVR